MKKKIPAKKLLIIIGICLIGLFLVYAGIALFYEKHFFPGSTVNGVKASGKTASYIMDEINKKGQNYKLEIIDGDGNKNYITSSEIGMKIADKKSEFEKVLSKQNGFLWLGSLIHPVRYTSGLVVSYDSAKLDEALSKLPAVTKKDITATENATYQYKDGKFSVKPEIYGDNVNMDLLKKTAGEDVTSMKPSIDIKKSKIYVQPTVKKDDKTLKSLVADMNKVVGIKYSYNEGDTISKDTLAGFLTVGQDMKMAYNEDAIRAYVKQLEDKYNTVGKPCTLQTSYGQTVSVPGGTYGWKIDENKEVAQIEADLKAGKDVSRGINYSSTAASHDTSKPYGNSYIELNLTAQHVFVYKDGAKVFEADGVSGNPNKGHATDVGTFFIQFKRSPSVLNGRNDDGSAYHTKVSYWMPFYNGEGFHDATWQPSFGGTYYQTRGSHGCFNMSLGEAGKMYSLVNAGMPVLISQLPGTENSAHDTADAKSMDDAITEAAPGLSNITTDSASVIDALWKKWTKLTPAAKQKTTQAGTLQAWHDRLAQVQAEADAQAAAGAAPADNAQQ